MCIHLRSTSVQRISITVDQSGGWKKKKSNQQKRIAIATKGSRIYIPTGEYIIEMHRRGIESHYHCAKPLSLSLSLSVSRVRAARNTPWSRNKKRNKRKDKKENRACQYNGAEMRKGEANDISWTIVLWAATVAAIISRLTLSYSLGEGMEGRIKVHRLPREGGGGKEGEGCRPYGAYTQTTHTLT